MMGYSSTVMAIVGMRIPTKPYQRKVRAYKHDYSEEFQYDPRTGLNLWETKNFLKDEAEALGLTAQDTSNAELGEHLYVGILVGETPYGEDASRAIDAYAISDAFTKAQTKLSIFLGRKVMSAEIGLYVVKYHSC